MHSFRGAVNNMELMLACDQTMVRTNYFLTQSFRFGSEIAFTANTCLYLTNPQTAMFLILWVGHRSEGAVSLNGLSLFVCFWSKNVVWGMTHENGHLKKNSFENVWSFNGGGEALSPTVCDGIQNHTYYAPKWWPEMAILMPFLSFQVSNMY